MTDSFSNLCGQSDLSIAFHLQRPFHHAILNPVFALLEKEFPCLLSDDPEAIIAFRPRLLVMAHRGYDLFRQRLTETFIVFLRHGFASKNQLGRAVQGSDFTCVSSDWMRRHLMGRSLRPRLGFWVTGFVPMDAVFRPTTDTRVPPSFSRGPHTLLYAPTFNETFSSAPMLPDDWVDRLRRKLPGLNIIIKPHPNIARLSPAWLDPWRRLATGRDRVLLVEDQQASIYDYFRCADLMVSDASSVAFYYVALNRPIVLLRNPRWREDPVWVDPDGPEWQWRDIGIDLDQAADLPDAVVRSLDRPDEFAERRLHYRQRVFGDLLDGRAAERVAARIRTLLRSDGDDSEWPGVAWNALLSRAAGQRELSHSLTFRIRRELDRRPRLARVVVGSVRLLDRWLTKRRSG